MHKDTLVLAIETSGRIGSVALGFGGKIAVEASFSGIMRHSAEIFPAISKLLDNSGIKPIQIEHLYISNGPGSFTGLRIAATIAKTMYLANSLKIVTVDTLDVIASNVIDSLKSKDTICDILSEAGEENNKIAVVLDAKRGQFFIAVYNIVRDRAEVQHEKILADSLMTAMEFLNKFAGKHEPIWLLGDGLVYHREEFQAEGVKFLDEKYWSPHARKVYFLGWNKAQKQQFADPVELKPFYLCRPEIRPKQR